MAKRSFIEYLNNPGTDAASLAAGLRAATGVEQEIAEGLAAAGVAVAAAQEDAEATAADRAAIEGTLAAVTAAGTAATQAIATDRAAATTAISTDRQAALTAINNAAIAADTAADTALADITTARTQGVTAVTTAAGDTIADIDAAALAATTSITNTKAAAETAIGTTLTNGQAALTQQGADILTGLNIVKADTEEFAGQASDARDEAVAAAASVSIPVIAPGDAGKVLTVKVDESGTEWVDGGVDLPAGGAIGQYLRKDSADDQDASWQDATSAGELQAGVIAIASSAEALAGTNDSKAMTPSKVSEAIAASSVAASFTGAFSVASDGQPVSITSGDADFVPDRAFVGILNDDYKQFSLRVTSKWQGGAGDPFNNNDSVLSEIYTDVLSSSANQTWAFSGANAYHNIPAGVTDSGMRVGVLGWAVSVNVPGYAHAGRLNQQFGVWGRAGFQGGGAFQSPSTGRITDAIGVRGEIATDTPNARIDVAKAGLFESVCTNAQIDDNFAVYARAGGATTRNYSFWGEAGKFKNKGDMEITSGATDAVLFNNGTNAGFATNIGKTAGQYMAINGSTWTALSDARIKTDVETVSVLDKLDQFRAVTYTNLLTGMDEFGVIAQEMAQCFPEFVVKGNDDPAHVPTGIDDPGMWQVTGYERMGAYALQGLKELMAEVRALRARVVELEGKQGGPDGPF